MFFEVQDPRGIKVVCSTEVWELHILDEHPEMEDEEELVEETIRSPHLFIYEDRDYPERNLYYWLHSSRRYYIKVVVEFKDHTIGEVITAFKTDSPKSGEKIIWPV